MRSGHSTPRSRPMACRLPRSNRHTASPKRRCSCRPSRPSARATVVHLDREHLADGQAVRVTADARWRDRAGVMRSDCSQPVGGHRRPGRAHRMCRRARRRDLVAREQHRPAILGTPRGVPADVRRHTAVAAGDGKPRRRCSGRSARGCGPGTSACTSTASCTSPAAVRTCCSSTAVTTTHRTSRPPRRRPRRWCGGDTSRRSPQTTSVVIIAERASGTRRDDPAPARRRHPRSGG